MEADGVYDHNAPGQADDRPYGYLRPASPWEEKLTGQATEVVDMDRAEISAVVRPALPQIELFPPRFGYSTRELGIRDILRGDRNLPDRRADFSGSPAGYQGSSRNGMELA